MTAPRPAVACALLCALGAGCFSTEGPSPPATTLYYPTGLTVSPAGETLYVANSDFDLQYNGGTVQAYDLARLRDVIPPVWDPGAPGGPCRGLGDNASPTLYPGRCGPIDPDAPPDGRGSLVRASVEIGAFATGALLAGTRLFVPVRGDPSLTWIDTDPARGTLECGQGRNSGRCDERHRAGTDPADNSRGVVLPNEPMGLALSQPADVIVVAHQTSAAVSLFTHATKGTPTLEFVLGGLPAGPAHVASLPVPRVVLEPGSDIAYQPGFLVTFRAAPEVDLIRYVDDAAASPARPFVRREGAVGVTLNSTGYDSRGIALDTQARLGCEAGCPADTGPDRNDCLAGCGRVPIGVFVGNRSPPSLLIGETRATDGPTGSDDLVTFYDTVPLMFGVSQVAVGSIRDRTGAQRTRVFAVCFDSRLVFVWDPEARRIAGTIRTGRGPHAFSVDPVKPFAYIGHFTDSYIGVVDLDEAHDGTFQTIVASVGLPRPPRASK